MRKILGLMVCIFVMFSGNCFASTGSSVLINSLKNDPNYIYIGGVGSGFAILLDKTSINVHEYNPPYYTIAIVEIWWAYPNPEYGEMMKEKVHRYRYDYEKKKIYFEKYDINNNPYWEELNPKELLKLNSSQPLLVEAEMAFYLAYNMSFFDKPMSSKAKEYIYNHK